MTLAALQVGLVLLFDKDMISELFLFDQREMEVKEDMEISEVGREGVVEPRHSTCAEHSSLESVASDVGRDTATLSSSTGGGVWFEVLFIDDNDNVCDVVDSGRDLRQK